VAAPVVIVDYDPRWPATFASLADRLVAAIFIEALLAGRP
jgi:GrpB-like predicted nucleotidyltransferase (UPF0157 family)